MESCVIRFNEIWLKGKNRDLFIRRLIDNIKMKLDRSGISEYRLVRRWDHLFLVSDASREDVTRVLSKTFGISNFMFVKETTHKLDDIKKAVLDVASRAPLGTTFRIVTKRSFKNVPYTSPELNATLGRYLAENGHQIDMETPDVTIFVTVTKHGTYVYTEKSHGLGGLPVGVSGRTLCLMSGGIDSPVAAWMMMKRGCEVTLLHFYRTPVIEDKIINITRKLSEYHPTKLIGVNFLPVQKRIVELTKSREKEKYRMVVYRRLMFIIAKKVADELGIRSITTGESLGQVASQTMENMYAITHGLDILVFRPLLAYDKEEIIGYAKSIGTYDLSLQPYFECCTYMVPKHPVLRAKPETVDRLVAEVGEFDRDLEVSEIEIDV